MKERTYEHQAQPMSGSKPVTLGQGYSTIAWVPSVEGSWALPLLHERITSFSNPIEKAAAQPSTSLLTSSLSPIIFMGCRVRLCQRMCYRLKT